MKVIVTYNTRDQISWQLAGRICRHMEKYAITAVLCDKPDCGAENIVGCRCMVTVGGDGTILHWGKLAARYDIPLLGVNTGRLGFMANLEPVDVSRIHEIVTGSFATSRRMIMSVEIRRANGTVELREALNDVVAERERGSKLPEFRVSCGASEVSRIRADGVIFSTPTGSTAYALSAGGAIMAPDLEGIEFTPLCPHTLFSRPMIFSVNNEITLRCSSYQNSAVTISVDSESGIPFGEGDVLRLTKSEHALRLIEAGEGFFGAVRNKLMTPLK